MITLWTLFEFRGTFSLKSKKVCMLISKSAPSESLNKTSTAFMSLQNYYHYA